ncbi:putative signal transducing protein [Aliikangiella sp. IMCC44653]
MIKIASRESILEINHLKNIFENNGIDCFIKNVPTQSLIGEIAATAWPEVWIYDIDDLDKANHLINELTDASSGKVKTWQCLNCEEENEVQFKVCWQCNKPSN